MVYIPLASPPISRRTRCAFIRDYTVHSLWCWCGRDKSVFSTFFFISKIVLSINFVEKIVLSTNFVTKIMLSTKFGLTIMLSSNFGPAIGLKYLINCWCDQYKMLIDFSLSSRPKSWLALNFGPDIVLKRFNLVHISVPDMPSCRYCFPAETLLSTRSRRSPNISPAQNLIYFKTPQTLQFCLYMTGIWLCSIRNNSTVVDRKIPITCYIVNNIVGSIGVWNMITLTQWEPCINHAGTCQYWACTVQVQAWSRHVMACLQWNEIICLWS